MLGSIARVFGRKSQSDNLPYSSQRDRWSKVESFHKSWGDRAAFAAQFIQPRSSVIDLGCGRMQLREHLPDGCSYFAADMTKWTDEVIEIDLDAGLFPPGSYDVATLLGVLEYLNRPEDVLTWARAHCKRLITSYSHEPLTDRDKNGWVNSYSVSDMTRLLANAGWSAMAHEYRRELKATAQMIYVCGYA